MAIRLSRDPFAALRQKGRQAFRVASLYVLAVCQLECLTPALVFNARRILLALLFLTALSSHAQDNLLVNEFVASNSQTLEDEDGQSSDWIEIYNAGNNTVNLNGWYLTDSAAQLTKWRFPSLLLGSKAYLIVFASGKNRTNTAGPLHTTFQLSAGGEYLGLVRPDGTTVVSQFSPTFPPQQTDISYGRDRITPSVVGYFPTATPGAANSTGGPGFAGAVQFSRRGGTFSGAFSLTLSNTAPASNAVIRYTLDGSVPSSSSSAYNSPISISTTRQVRARVFQTGLLPGPLTSETYVPLDGALATVNSDLPLVVLYNFGAGPVPAEPLQFVELEIYEPQGGRSSLTNAPDVRTRAGFKRRGNSTLAFAKSSFTLETWDELDSDRDLSLLNLPEDSDWVLYAPNKWEPVMIHNPFMYELSRQAGSWAPRTRFVEVYVNTAGGPLTATNYNGIYVLAEKITRGSQRVDIEKLRPENTNPPEITGGYLYKQDQPEADGWSFRLPVPMGLPTAENPGNLLEPDPQSVTSTQQDYLIGYLQEYADLLDTANYTDPVNGYVRYIDVPSWIDTHMLYTLSLNVDALRFSSYFYKPRNGKLFAGPIWDFDRSLGSTELRDWNPRTWRDNHNGQLGTDMFNYLWYHRLFRDPDFFQKWIDRWQELRGGPWTTANMFALVDRLSNELREAQPREVSRWPNFTEPRAGSITQDGYSFDFGVGTYQGEVSFMKQWLSDRLQFMDTNFVAAATLSHPGGSVSNGFILTMTAPAGSIYYTLDGTDPRTAGGAVSALAQLYTGPIQIAGNRRVVARVRDGTHMNLTGANNPPLSSPWSGPVAATFVVSTPPLVITEIMYHPQNPPPGNTNDADNFEFIELKNIGSTTLNLAGFRFTNGIDFNFSNGSVTNLGPGQRVLVVHHRAAFLSRYPGVTNIAGEYTAKLDNSGERLYLEGPLREPILDFAYNDAWYPATDGSGFSLVIVNENAPLNSWGLKSSWRPSTALGGSPGQDDPAPPAFAPVLITEALTHTDPPLLDTIELFNSGLSDADIGGWFLSDDLGQPKKFRIPAGTTIPAGGYRLFDEGHFNVNNGINVPFSLSSQGDEVYLFAGDAATNLTGYAHGFGFGAAANSVSFGRHVISTGEEHFWPQSTNTLGTATSGPKVGPLVINEIMYHPPDLPNGLDNQEAEFIEILNLTGAPVPLFDPAFPTNTWKLRDAVDFVFPPNLTVPANGWLLIVSFDPAIAPALNAFRARYNVPASVPIYGPYEGKLDNSADKVELAKPDPPDPSGVTYVLVDKVNYNDEAPWPATPDGFGYSLQRRVSSDYGNDPANWVASQQTAGRTNILDSPPVISSQPAGLTVIAGDTAQFNVSAVGLGTLTYQWQFNGASLPGATNASLVLSSVQTNQAGPYSVLVANFAGTVLSSNAQLTVLPPIPPDALGDWVGYWKMDDGSGTLARDASANVNHGRLTNGPIFTTSGRLNGALSFDGIDDYVVVPDADVLEFAGRRFTVALWLKTTLSTRQALVEKQAPDFNGMFLLAINRDNVWTGGFSVWTGGEWLDSNWRGVADGQWHHLAVTFDGSAFRLYRDGMLDKTATRSALYSATTLPMNFGRFATGNQTWYFRGLMDEVYKFNRALSGGEIAGMAGIAPLPNAPRTLTIASATPNSGVAITVSPAATNGQASGTTAFTRVFSNNTVVTLTAPATAAGNNFLKWQLDGIDWTSSQTASVTMDSDHTVTAIYQTRRIVPLGDSITQGDNTHNSWRRPLWQMLTNAGIYSDFVGSLNSNFGGGPPNPDFDLQHEGHWGWRADELLAQLPTWLTGYTPDMALLYAGSNDAFQNQSTSSTTNELAQIIDTLRAANSNMTVLLAKLIGTTDSSANPRINDLNAQIDVLAAAKNTAGSRVFVVDQNTGFDPAADTYDGVHPNAAGEQKMAQKWFDAIQLAGGSAPAPPIGLQATAGNGQVSLTWNPSAGTTGYNVKRSTNSSASYVVIATNFATTGYVDLGVVNGTTYYYVVSALNAVGEGQNSAPVSAAPGPGLIPIVRVSFDEPAGTLTTNLGSAGGVFTLTTPQPTRTVNVPARSGGSGSIDMGTSPGEFGVDSAAPISQLAGLTHFTVTGWVNNRSVVQGPSGNRVLSCVNNGGDGFEVIYKNDGSLMFTVNQNPDENSPRSSAGLIPEDFNAGSGNWRFFAMTYDSALQQVKMYFGSNTGDAALNVTHTYSGRGPIGAGLGRLTIGHMNPSTRVSYTTRMFRGAIDEIRIYNGVLSPSEVITVQRQSLVLLGPLSQTHCPGTSASFSITAIGTGPITYQWTKNGSLIPGATSNSFTIPAVAASDAGTFCVRVSNPFEITTSCALLTVRPPTTATGPGSVTSCPGGTVSLATVAGGTGPFIYRWRKNGTVMAGVTSNNFMLTGVTAGDAGQYCVEVTGTCGSVTNCATVTVLTNTGAAGPISLGRCPGTSASFSTVAAGTGPFEYQWSRNGVALSAATNSSYTIAAVNAADAGTFTVAVRGACTSVTNLATLTVFTNTTAANLVSLTNCPGTVASFSTTPSGTGPFTYRWRKNGALISGATGSVYTISTVNAADAGPYCVEVTGACNSVTNCATLTVLVPVSAIGPAAQTNCPGAPVTFTTAASGSGPFSYQWSKNGASIGAATNTSFTLAAVTMADAGSYCVRVTGACGSVTNCATLTVLTNVTATSLASLTNCPGTSATFSTVASGSGPFHYQWKKDGAPISGATNSNLSIASVSATDAGVYCVGVTGACTSVTNCATLTVLTPTTATALNSLTNCPNVSALFATLASGTGSFSYQWRKNGATIPGATNNSFAIPSATAADAGGYCVVVTGACNSVTNCATLTVLVNVSAIGLNSLTNCPGTTASFTTVASGTGPFTYQWIRAGAVIPDATNVSFFIPAVTAADTGAYCVKVTGACNSVTNCATLTVLTPTSASSLVSLTNCPSSSAVFATVPSGSGPFRFQWRHSGVAILNATNSSLSLANVSTADAGEYCVEVTGACNTVTNCATLTVLEPTTATAVQSLTNCVGANATFGTVASGTGQFRYQWRHNGMLISAATNQTFTLDSMGIADAGAYCVEVTGACNSITNCATLTVYEPIVVSGPESLIRCPGTIATFITEVTGTSPVICRWLHNGVPIPYATNSSLLIGPLSGADAGTYCVEVSGACNNVTNCATLTVLTNTVATALSSLALCPGEEATFSTVASGSSDSSGFLFRWRHEGIVIPEATNSSLTLSSVSAAAAGQYCVEVTGSCDSVTNCATLAVHQLATAAGPAPLTNCPGTTALFSVAAGGTGPFAFQWIKDGALISNATNSTLMLASVSHADAGLYAVQVRGLCSSVTNSAGLTVSTNTSATALIVLTNCPGTSATFQTLADGTGPFRYLWRHNGTAVPAATNSSLTVPAVGAADEGEYCVEVIGACNSVTNCAWLEVLLSTLATGPHSLTNCPGTPATFTTGATGSGTLTYQWKKDGAPISGATNSSFAIPSVSASDAGNYCVEISGICGSVTNCATLTVLTPTSASSLESLTNCPATSALFATLPSGSPGLSGFGFQWRHDGIAILNATNSSLSLANVSAANAGEYCVEVTGTCNSVTNCATLTVLEATTAITLQSLTNCPGANATFTTVASGTGPFRYQWRHDGVMIPGATNETVSIASVVMADAGIYCVEVTGACNAVTNCAMLTVLEPIAMTGPLSLTNCPGTAAMFSTAASGSGPITYRWKKDSLTIAGATNSSLTISSVNAGDAGAYCVEISGPCNAVTNCATLTVLESTTATPFASQTNCPGSSATFQTTVSGTPGAAGSRYRWTYQGAEIPGATNTMLTLAAVTASNTGAYCVEVTGACNTVTNCAWLEVLVTTTAMGPDSLTNCPGEPAIFTTVASGTPDLSGFHYRWKHNGALIPGATNNSFSIPGVSSTNAGIYCVEVTGACGSVTNYASLNVLLPTTASSFASQIKCPGEPVNFSTSPSGSGPFRFRWTKDGAPISGATNSTFSIPAVTAVEAGVYCVQVTGLCNSVTNCATLTVLVPTTAAGPFSQTNCPGTPATFATVASGTGPFAYRWLKDGTPIPDATNDTFAIAAVIAADAGNYCVEVAGVCNSVTNCATLTVLVPLSAIGPASQTNCVGSAATFTPIPSGSGPFHFEWTKDGASIPNATNSSYTIPVVALAQAGNYCVEVRGPCNSVTNCAVLTVHETTTASALPSLTNCPGTVAVFATVASGTGPFTYQWGRNGAILPNATNETLSLAAVSAADAGIYCVEITGACNTVTNCATLTISELVTATGPPSQTNCPGTSATFTVTPFGTGPFRYQWTKDGAIIPNATNGSWLIANVNAADAGAYCVEVSGACSSITNCAALTVLESTTATALTSLTNCPGTSAQFSTVASGTGPFRYRWTHSGASIPGATNTTLLISMVSAADAGQYCVEVTGVCTTVTNCAALAVLVPTTAAGPLSQTNCPGNPVTFTTAASGTGPFVFQWRKDGVAIADATNGSITLPAVSAADTGEYCVEVSGACNSITNCATLTVLIPVTAIGPASQTNCPGTLVTFTTTASGSPDVSGFIYQWRKNGATLTGATNSSFTIAAVTMADAGAYCVQVTGACGSVTNCAMLTVLTNVTATSLVSLTNCPGTSATFSTVASGTAPFTYRWRHNGAVLPNTTNATLSLAALSAADAGIYCVEVTGTCNTVTNCATLTMLTPTSASSFVSLTNCPSSSAVFATVPSGSGPFRFQWRHSGVAIPGATNSSLNLANVSAADAGEYCIEVIGACNSFTQCATLTILEATTATALQSMTNCPGTSAQFSTVASGTGPFHHLWTHNGALIPGATNSTFSISVVTGADAGSYCVEVIGACNSVTNCATLIVHEPTLASGPALQTNCFGTTATFMTLAGGTGPFYYQWSKDGTPIPGATDSTLSIGALTPADAGLYCVEVSGLCNRVTNCASLTVLTNTSATSLTSLTNCPGASAVFSTVASGAGPFTYRWRKNGGLISNATNNSFAIASVGPADAGTYCVEVTGACNTITNCGSLTVLTPTTASGPQSLTNCPGTSATLTTVASGTAPFLFQWTKNGTAIPDATNNSWVIPAVSAVDAGTYCVQVTGTCGRVTNCATITVLAPAAASSLTSLTNCSGTSAMFATLPSGSGPFRYRWLKSGALIASATNSSFVIPFVTTGDAGEYCVEVNGACGSMTNCATLTVLESASATALISLTNCPGTSATFSTVASGTPPFSFRWMKNGTFVSGATNSSFTIPVISATDAGTYCSEVAGACGSVTNCATLAVNAPTTAAGPTSLTNCPGTSATFMTVAAGTGPFSYRWIKNGTAIPDATNSSLILTSVSAADVAAYCVEIRGACNNITNCASLTVLTPTTASSLISLTNCPGASAVFSTVASGTGPFSYRWRKNGALLANATNNSFTIASVSAAAAGTYCVEVTGACGSVTNCGTLTVKPSTSATALSDVTKVVGESVTFSTVPSGTGPFSFSWSKDGASIAGAEASSLGLTSLTLNDSGLYCVRVAGECGSVTNCARLTVQPLSYTVTTLGSPSGAGSTSGDGTYTNFASVTVVATADAGFAFTNWTENGTVVSASASYLFTLTTNRALVANFFSTGPIPIVHLPFNENSGNNAVNVGSAGGTLSLTPVRPVWNTNVPLNVGAASAVDFGGTAGDYGVDSMAPIGQLGGLTKFSITGWINNRDAAQGSGGNRLVSWLGLDNKGAELVYRGDGSLILSVNEEPSNARSSTGMIPVDFEARAANWRFFAVTYDATTQRALFYFGSNTSDAILDKSVPYTGRGAVGAATARLTVGHLNPERRPGRLNRMFRGLIDEVQIFGSALTLSEIINVQRQTFGPPSPPPPPAANFTSSPATGAAPLVVNFTDSSTGSISNRFWNFGDGDTTNTTAVNLAHTYPVPGTYSVSLTVSGPGGATTLTRPGYIVVTNAAPPAQPVANFSGTPTKGAAPLTVNFTDSSTGSISNRFWNFGDGATTNTTAMNAAHTYNAPGTNTVSLSVSGPGGSNTLLRTAYIVVTNAPPPAPPVANFSGSPTDGTAPLTVTFSDTSTGSITNRSWNFGDGMTTNTTAASLTHTYSGPATNSVSLTVTGPGGLNTLTRPSYIVVTNAVTPPDLVGDWKLDDGSGGTATDSSDRGHHGTLLNGPVWTNGYCAGGLSFDGVNDFVQVPSTEALQFAGRSFSVALRVKTSRTAPQALVEKQHTGFNGFFLLALNRDNVVPGGVSVWTGDSWIDSNFNGFTDGQWHHVAVTYDGSTFRLYRDGVLDKTMAASAPYVATQLPLHFGRFVTGNVGWYFRGQMDEIRRYNRALSEPEIAALTPCASSSPMANFSGSPTTGNTPLTVSFTDTSTGSITSRFWDFGDGVTTNATVTTLTHTYADAGTYTVALVASGAAGSNTLTRSNYIVVTNAPPPVASFTGNPTNGAAPLSVTFTDSSTGPITNRFWNFGDGATTNTSATSVTHIYDQPETNTVSLTVTGFGGANTLTRPAYIVVTNPPPPPPPVANFTAGPTRGPAPLMVFFTNQSLNATSFLWNFGDGKTSTAVHPTNTYTNAGLYTTSLSATGPGGTTNLTRTDFITVTSPPPRNLTVLSLNPSNGVPITVSLADTNGMSNGTTPFIRVYLNNVSVTLTAPQSASTNTFQRWERNGVSLGTNRTVSVTLDGDSTLLARYEPASGGGVGLIGHWKLDDGSGSTGIDSSGLGYHGTLLNGPTWTNGQCNGALNFDGVNDYMRVPDADVLDFANTNFTMALWVRTSRTSAQALAEKQHSGFNGFFLLALNRDSVVPGGFSIWTGSEWIDSNFRGVTDGQWHHLAVTFDGTAFRLYRDGTLDLTKSGLAYYANTSLPLNFGRSVTGNIGWYFRGQMDELRRYNRTLSDSEIAGLMECPPAGSVMLASTLWRIAPALRLESLRHDDGMFRLVIRHVDGTPLAPERMKRLELYATADFSLPLTDWTKLNTRPIWVDGAAQWDDPESVHLTQRFYILRENAITNITN